MSLTPRQGLNALAKLFRGPCASVPDGLFGTIRHFAATASASVDPFSRNRPQDRDSDGAKAILTRILESAGAPLTADAVWAKAKEEGLPSKNFTKKMLQEMRHWGRVLVKPGKGGAAFEYRLHADYAALPPEERQPKKVRWKPPRPNLENPELLVETPASRAAGLDWLLGEAPSAKASNERRPVRASNERPPARAPADRQPARGPYERFSARASRGSPRLYLGKKHKVELRPMGSRPPLRSGLSQEATLRKEGRKNQTPGGLRTPRGSRARDEVARHW